MRLRTALIALLLMLASAHVAACSLAPNLGDEHDLPPVYQASSMVFVARLTEYAEFVPFGSQHYMGRMKYALVEAIKGRPASQGLLFEPTGKPAVEDIPPGPACGPWLVQEHNVGADYLVFADRDQASGRLIPHPRSVRLDPATGESAKLVAFIRTLRRSHLKP